MNFTPGLKLAAAFYTEIVAPIVGDLPHAAALLGEGSDVLGFDTERSTDHSWGPRLQLFVQAGAIDGLRAALEDRLPETFHGWPVRYERWQTQRVEHHVEVTTLHEWVERQLGFNPWTSLTTQAWLATPQQLLLETTAGAVFHDDTGELTALRETLRWYPDDLWLWLMACQWHLIEESESFVGRTAEVGDDLGSRLAAARLTRDLIRLCFLQERRYAPYAKWLGTAFARLDSAKEIDPALHEAVSAPDHATREAALGQAYEAVARRHNALGVTPPLEPATSAFDVHIAGAVRPFRVLNAHRFAQACREAIRDQRLRHLPLVGAIDQLADTTDLLIHFSGWPRRLAALFEQDLSALPDA